MTKRSDIRRLAMQALYQIDMRGDADLPAIHEAVREDAKDPADGEEAYALAAAAWGTRGEADAKVVQLAPEWPTHRQPPVDRAILRLAWHEMSTGRTPVKVAINEAVELAKSFCAEQSPSFINGVLDKMAKDVKVVAVEAPGKKESPDDWLADAVGDEQR